MIFKNTQLKVLALGLACTLSLSILAAQQPEQKKPVILWDLHKVILKSNRGPKAIMALLYNFERKRELVSNLSRALCSELLTTYMNSKKNQGPKSDATGEAYMVIAEKHNNLAFAALIQKIANSQKVVPAMADIVLQLHEKGVVQYIGSNIGKGILEDLRQSAEWLKYFNKPGIFNYEGSQTVDYRSAEPIQKPNPKFFENFLAQNNISAQNVVFIDDKQVNIDAANNVGMGGEICETPEQLKTALNNKYGFGLK